MTVEKWLGSQQFSLLLKLCGVTSKANLNPIWKRIASAKNSELDATLQVTFGYYKDQFNELHITFSSYLSLLATKLSLFWAVTTLDAIGTGIQFF